MALHYGLVKFMSPERTRQLNGEDDPISFHSPMVGYGLAALVVFYMANSYLVR